MVRLKVVNKKEKKGKTIINEEEYPIMWSYLRRMFGSASTMQENLAFIRLQDAREFEAHWRKLYYSELRISRRIEKFTQKFQECIEMQPHNTSLSLRVSKSEAAMVKDKEYYNYEEKGSCSVKKLMCNDKDEEEDQGTWITENTAGSLQNKKVRHQMVKERSVKCFDSLHSSLKKLCIHAKESLANGEGISIPFNDGIFGMPIDVNIHQQDIFEFCTLQPISGHCILVYMWYLYKKLEKNRALDRFRFVNPFHISYIPLTTEDAQTDARTIALAERLHNVSSNQLVIAPCNVGFHWILTVIDPHRDTVSLFNPLFEHQIHDNWKEIVSIAISMFNEKLEKRGNKQPTWEIIKCPTQPDNQQCGFFVLRFMKDIIEEVTRSGSNISLHSHFGKLTYSREDIDEVRVEWANIMLSHI